ncbi:MAG: rhomboid family intramembrane serine protease, partial [Armatimonadetes bacterium]|nr:rhomboid family intramembrane serine protease [Armatimonadota bacterium]
MGASSPRVQSDRIRPALATCLLIAAQLVVWLVVRRHLVVDGDWLQFAIRPDQPGVTGVLTGPFIHLEPAHLGVNLVVLWLFGANLERAIGSLSFLAIYLGAAAVASLMHWAVGVAFQLYPEGVGAAVGSSGAVAGVLGAVWVRLPQSRLGVPLLRWWTFPTTPLFALWLAYTLLQAILGTVQGVSHGIGHWAHFAGFTLGLGGAQLLGMPRAARIEYLIEAAERATRTNNLIAAAQAWSALLSLRPADLQVRTALVSTRLAMEDHAGARRLAREGVESPTRAHQRRAALEAYRALRPLIPEMRLHPGLRYRLGCWLAEEGEGEFAIRTLLESMREDGATPASASALFRAG